MWHLGVVQLGEPGSEGVRVIRRHTMQLHDAPQQLDDELEPNRVGVPLVHPEKLLWVLLGGLLGLP